MMVFSLPYPPMNYFLAAFGKCGKENWWLCNAWRGKSACFELTAVLTA